MDALALGVLTRKGVSGGKRREKGKGKDKKKGKGKADAVEEEMEQEPVVALGDARGADVVELAALEAAWAGYMRRMEEGNGDQGEYSSGVLGQSRGCVCLRCVAKTTTMIRKMRWKSR